jgi:hypothetical protein
MYSDRCGVYVDRCGPRTECVGAVEPLQWLPYNTVSCPLIGAVSPPQTQISRQSTTDVSSTVTTVCDIHKSFK